jgi:hypothetical protein
VVKGKQKALPNNAPIYSGKDSEDLAEWMFLVNKNLKICGITEETDKLSALTNFVKGNAL